MTDSKAMILAPIRDVRTQLEDRKYRELVKSIHCPNATDLEFEHCMATAWHLGLDPVARQIFFIPVWDSKQRREQWVPVVAVAGLLAVAQRTGEFQGRTRPQWCGQDGAWRDVWLADGPPAAAQVGVWREGFQEPLYGIVLYREYCRRTRDGRPMAQWGTMPSHMIMKCALAQALRHSFSVEMAGDYGVRDVSMPGEPGRFRVRDQTPEPEALPEHDPVPPIIEAMREAKDTAELDEHTAKLKEHSLTELDRDIARAAWNEAKERIEAAAQPKNVSRETKGNGRKTKKNGKTNGKAKAEPTPEPDAAPAGEHDYGPPPWDKRDQGDMAATVDEPGPPEPEQPGFGFDDDSR